MKVFLVKLDWSTEDSNDIELTVYGTYDKATESNLTFFTAVMTPMNPNAIG